MLHARPQDTAAEPLLTLNERGHQAADGVGVDDELLLVLLIMLRHV